MHAEAHAAVRNITRNLDLPRVSMDGLDIGGQPVNGSTHEWFENTTWTVIDIANVPGVDIVADATTWEPTREWDVVQSTECLEHVKDWRGIVTTAQKALKPGGWLVLTCASDGRRPHGANGEWDVPADQHYGNVSEAEFRAHAETLFTEVNTWYTPSPGDLYAWCRK